MEHRGISMGEAEELLRTHPVEALLPQLGTGLLLGTAAGISGSASPDCKFINEGCYFPDEVTVDEEFLPLWTFINNGDAGQCFLGVIYRDTGYLLWYGNKSTGETAEIVTLDPETGEQKPITINDFLGTIGEGPITQSGIISLQFIVGWIEEWLDGTARVTVTDRWDVAVDVQAPGLPSWVPWAAGIGLAGAGLGLVYVTTRK